MCTNYLPILFRVLFSLYEKRSTLLVRLARLAHRKLIKASLIAINFPSSLPASSLKTFHSRSPAYLIRFRLIFLPHSLYMSPFPTWNRRERLKFCAVCHFCTKIFSGDGVASLNAHTCSKLLCAGKKRWNYVSLGFEFLISQTGAILELPFSPLRGEVHSRPRLRLFFSNLWSFHFVCLPSHVCCSLMTSALVSMFRLNMEFNWQFRPINCFHK